MQTAGAGGGARDLTPMVGEKRARELEVAVDGYVDIPLRTPLPAPKLDQAGGRTSAGTGAEETAGEAS